MNITNNCKNTVKMDNVQVSLKYSLKEILNNVVFLVARISLKNIAQTNEKLPRSLWRVLTTMIYNLFV